MGLVRSRCRANNFVDIARSVPRFPAYHRKQCQSAGSKHSIYGNQPAAWPALRSHREAVEQPSLFRKIHRHGQAITLGIAHLLTSGHLIAQRFAISEVAGSGGMGTVYKAADLHTGKNAALKLLHSGNASIAEAERFLREAKLLSELRHPGIVSYVAHGLSDDGRPFLAMEWLEGEDLGKRLRRELLTVAESLTLIRLVLDALSAAHERGIVHRDLKPSNRTPKRDGHQTIRSGSTSRWDKEFVADRYLFC